MGDALRRMVRTEHTGPRSHRRERQRARHLTADLLGKEIKRIARKARRLAGVEAAKGLEQ